jgi:membrane protein YqaA with SNARE-associated domain
MISHHAVAILASPATRSVWRWLRHVGGLGFIPLGLVDSSVIPIPGMMDALTIVLAAHDRQLWAYYAAMATLGSVVGGYVTYRLARKQGENALAKRFSRKKVEKVNQVFARWGFGAIAIPAILPPPMPLVPFLVAAGAMQYSLQRFIAALTLGRLIRYGLLAYLGAIYGRQILSWFSRFGYPILYAVIGIALLGAAVLIIRWRMSKLKGRAKSAA